MLNTQFDPFPTLSTERLHLRRLSLDDAEQMFAMRSSEEMMAYIPRPRAKTVNDATAVIQMMLDSFEKRENMVWAMSLKNDPKLIGTIGFWRMQPANYRAEVGYLLHSDYWQKGLTYEALQAVLKYGFEVMNCHSIEAVIAPQNVASARLLEKNGFVKEAHFRENCYFDGRFLDSVVYAQLKTAKYE